jgi:hypothetical protein
VRLYHCGIKGAGMEIDKAGYHKQQPSWNFGLPPHVAYENFG